MPSDELRIRQLIDPESSTYSYLVWEETSREAAIIDPVEEQVQRDLQLIRELRLKLIYSLETHVHADHVTGAGALRQVLGCRIGLHRNSRASCADIWLEDGQLLPLGGHALEILYTPGHTDTDVCYLAGGTLFTGDTLLIHGSGRTDFQSGDPGKAYDSITGRIFSLPDQTVIYPGHDYRGHTLSTVGEERRYNPRLGNGRSRSAYIRQMQGLHLAKPRHIDIAVPRNRSCGR